MKFTTIQYIHDTLKHNEEIRKKAMEDMRERLIEFEATYGISCWSRDDTDKCPEEHRSQYKTLVKLYDTTKQSYSEACSAYDDFDDTDWRC